MRNLICVVIMVFLPLSLASDTQHRFKVHVRVTIDDETTKSIFSSYVKRELRSLGDVDIVGVGDEWEYMLDFVAIEQTYASTDRKTGTISIAWNVYKSASHLLDESSGLYFHGDVVFQPLLRLRVNSTENLDSSCKEIVAQFDTKNLEVIRENRWYRIKNKE